ncbi:uncharacterized protein LOC131940883 [Physella acuta]|uniref:uncharacterized protein LOC131940883 n=1 Tax=Physella acuta TaxID=109671 RepID=UPI0027DDE20B|nr:uncharacterized protein LOC131940883 [Physella acuta]
MLPNASGVADADELQETNTTQFNVVGDLANFIALCALFTYGFRLMGRHYFKPLFFRQLASIFQLARILLDLSVMLPLIVHWQAMYILPDVIGPDSSICAAALMVFNIFLAWVVQRLCDLIMDKLMSPLAGYFSDL